MKEKLGERSLLASCEHLELAMLEANTFPKFSSVSGYSPFCAKNHKLKCSNSNIYSVEGAFYKPSQVIEQGLLPLLHWKDNRMAERSRNFLQVTRLLVNYGARTRPDVPGQLALV